MSLATGILLHDRYEVVRSIKSGGMGAVYEARDRTLAHSPCAVKEILEGALTGPDAGYVRDKFKAEVEALSSLDHAGVPRVRDYFAVGSAHYIVMDLVQGKALDEELSESLQATGRPLEPEVVAADAMQILDILIYLHGRGLLHRDVKPANLIRETSSGRIKLVDFGLARSYGGQQMMTMVGTPGYCAQEQMAGRAEPRSDLYSVGATMHNMLTGISPKILSLEPLRDKMPDYRPGLAAIVEKATRRKADERYASAKEMQEALRSWFRSQTQPQEPAGPAPANGRPAPTQADDDEISVIIQQAPRASGSPSWLIGSILIGLGLAVGLAVGRGGSPAPAPPTPAGVSSAPVPMDVDLSTPAVPTRVHQPDYDTRAPAGYHSPAVKTVAHRPATSPRHATPRVDAQPDYPQAEPDRLRPSFPSVPGAELVNASGLLSLPGDVLGYQASPASGLLRIEAPGQQIELRVLRIHRGFYQLEAEAGPRLLELMRANGLQPASVMRERNVTWTSGSGSGRFGLVSWRVRPQAGYCLVAESVGLCSDPASLELMKKVQPRVHFQGGQ